jgi:purine nucleosidase
MFQSLGRDNMKTIILDTDIGTNPDDFFSLLILLHAKNINLPLIITGNKFPKERALFVKKILDNEKRNDIEVYAGEEAGCVDFFGQEVIDGYDAAIPTDYIGAIKKVIDTNDEVIYLNIQGCSNLSMFINQYPEYRSRMKVFHMGMTTKGCGDYIGGGTNMEADPLAAKKVYEAGLDLTIVGSHTTINDALRVHPETSLYKKLEASTHPNHQLLFKHLQEYHARRNIWPALHDPLTVGVALGENFVELETREVTFREDGQYKEGKGTSVLISKNASKAAEFMKFCTEII